MSVTAMRQRTTDAERKALTQKIAQMSPDQRAKLLQIAMPRLIEDYMVHIPHPKQQVFLALNSREVMYGGAAGGGKSDALLMAATQYMDVPGYSALILRRTWADLASPGAIMDRANTWFVNTPAKRKDGGRVWEFPTKTPDGRPAQPARLSFGHLQYENDRFKYASAEYQYIGFDELTHFSESMYTFLFSRLRRPQLVCLSCGKNVTQSANRHGGKPDFRHADKAEGKACKNLFPDPKVLAQYPPAPDGTSIYDVPLRMRSATNPGSKGHEWVRDRFVDERTRLKSAIFIPASIYDNPSLDIPSYVESLNYLTPVDRDRLLNGDWDVTESGEMFERWWFKIIDSAPSEGRVVRYWDNAASAGKGDYTVGAKMRLTPDGRWVVEDIVRGQWSSAEKEQVIKQTASLDGTKVSIRMEQEPGSSGKDVIHHYATQVLVGYDFKADKPTGNKEVRATPLASAAENGNVYLVKAAWNKPFLDEFNVFPIGNHDDIVDACSGAMGSLAFAPRARLLV